MHGIRIALLLTLTTASAVQATAADPREELIQQVESLRETLPPKDTNQRRALTERLAGMHYSVALELATEGIDVPAVKAQMEQHRRRALRLYGELRTGDGGRYQPLVGEARAMARFQEARLEADLERPKAARRIWEELVQDGHYPKILSEAALSLAEAYEADDAASSRALALYQLAIDHEAQFDTRLYGHYRRAWILRNQGRFRPAVAELKLALWDPAGKVKEEVLKDLVVFYTLSDLPAAEAIPYYEALGTKVGRPGLVAELADAYLAAGNKAAAVAALVAVTAKTPGDLLHLAKLLEETYGLRDWRTYGEALARAQAAKMAGLAPAAAAEVHKILTRLAVQLDAERLTAAVATGPFIATAELFARLFPTDPATFKVLAGAVTAEVSPALRVARLRRILADKPLALTAVQRATFADELVGALQRQGDHAGTAAAAAAAATIAPEAADRRRLRFVAASEAVDGGKAASALPELTALAKEDPADDIGRKSQMLAVRALGQRQDYAGVLAAAGGWLAAVDGRSDVKASKEYQAIVEIRERSEFEWAVGLGDKSEALAVFKAACLRKAFLPKSCANAKSLAVRLKRYEALIAVLASEGNFDELAAVYEANAYFDKAGEHYEKKLLTAPSAPVKDYLYVALLFEVGGRLADRDRVLDKLILKLQHGRFASQDEERLVFHTLRDAARLGERQLGLPWSPAVACAAADYVAGLAPGERSVEARLLACDIAPGPHWGVAVRAKVEALDAKQRALTFYGRNSKHRFERRLAAVSELGRTIDKYLPGADQATYLTLAGKAQAAYSALAGEIAATPMPAEATPDMLPGIKNALTAMAAPFTAKAAAYGQLHAVALARPTPAPGLGGEGDLAPAPAPPINYAAVTPYLRVLNNDPLNREALAKILEVYETGGQRRVAAYFRGRLQQLATKTL